MPEAVGLLTGWGRTAPTRAARTDAPTTTSGAITVVATAGPRGVIPRGAGRSYGDQAQNGGGLVVRTTQLDQVLGLDVRAATVRVQAGMRLGELLSRLREHGLFLPVLPGTRAVTVGGAIAADVHGKNHHRDGSIGAHVTRMSVLTADGQVRETGPDPGRDPGLFWGTLGGLGLTGIVLDADLRLLRVPSPWMSVDVRPARDLDALLAALSDADSRRYSVAWVDCLAAGRHAGRGVVTAGDHASIEQAEAWRRSHPAGHDPQPDPQARLRAPAWAPPGLLNRWTVAALNDAYFHAARPRQAMRQAPTRFFNPLDVVDGWNRLYGPRGLVQYQCLVPDAGVVEKLLAMLRDARAPVFLAVLKRFGPGCPGPLSFPRPGWTLAVDVPAGFGGLSRLLDSLDETVTEAAGNVYLAKDSRLRPQLLPELYPQLDVWHELRERVDPDRRWQSDMSRRLGL